MRAGWPSGGLVVAGGVEGQFAQEFAGGRVDNPDVQVLDKHQDGGPGVGSPDADVVQAAVDPEGEFAISIDPVAAHAVVGVGCPVAGSGLRAGCVGGGGGGPVGQGAVRPLAVVEAGEVVEQGLELGEGGGLGFLGGEPFLEGLGRVGRAARCQ